ncbi:MAG TPA: hypothetical protein VK454_02070 [Myxococcaceae bacterium]|nr:hypothetical protein [Myxococcaceae bacterium]
MKPDDAEARLRAALADAHREDATRTPPFDRMWRAAGRGESGRSSPVPWLVTCASLAAAMGLAAWLVSRLGPPPAPLPTGTHWRGPTDFLLETPGLVTLRTVPELGPSSTDPLLRPPVDERRGTP